MQDIFANEDTEAVLLIDAENAFNSINWKVMLHNLNFICQVITTYITNCCYITQVRLFIIGRGEILSKEATTQGDATALGCMNYEYYHWFIFYLSLFQQIILVQKKVAFGDSFTVTGKLTSIRSY